MSMDWLKIDKKLASGSKMVALVELTGCEVETLLGRLVRFWTWVDDHVKEDALLNMTSVGTLIRLFNYDETFWTALQHPRVTWLGRDERGYFIPEWDKWFSESAKQRMANAERKRRSRANAKPKPKVTKKRDTSHGNVTGEVTENRDQKRLDENRTEESRPEENTPSEPKQTNASAPTQASGPMAGVPAGRAPLPPTTVALKNLEGREVDWQPVIARCRTTLEKLGIPTNKPLDPKDRELILKVNALVQLGALSEHELWDSCEAVHRKFQSGEPPTTPRCGYWHGVLTSKLSERGVNFNALLKHIRVPDAVLKPKQAG